MSSKLFPRREKLHSSKPYDRPKSLLQRVRRHVSDYLPLWLNPSTWVPGTAGGRKTQTSSRSADEGNEEEEEEDPGDILNGRAEPSEYCPDTTGRTVSVLPPLEPDTFTRVKLLNAESTAQENLANEDIHSEKSEASTSTSGCSSLAPSQDKKRGAPLDRGTATRMKGLQASKLHLEKVLQQRSSSPLVPARERLTSQSVPANTNDLLPATNLPSHKRTRKSQNKISVVKNCVQKGTDPDVPVDAESSSTRTSLWSEDNDNRSEASKGSCPAGSQPSGQMRKKPRYSVSPFGSPLALSRSSSRESLQSRMSPFYPGPTTYGGASAHRKADVGTPYNNTLRVNAVRVCTTGSKEVLSSAARKILSFIEKATVPQKVEMTTVQKESADSSLSYAHSVYAQKPLRPQPLSTTIFLTDGPARPTAPVHASSGSQPESSPVPPKVDKLPLSTSDGCLRTREEGTERRSGGAVRTRVSQTVRPSKQHKAMDFEIPEQPVLPEISLVPQGFLQSFKLSIPGLKSSSPAVSEKEITKCTKEIQESTLMVPDKNPVFVPETSAFVFSSPIENKPLNVVLDNPTKPEGCDFKFRSPVYRTDLVYEAEKNAFVPSQTTASSVARFPSVNFTFSAATSSSRNSTEFRSKPELEVISSALPGGLKTDNGLFMGGSVMDILGKPTDSATRVLSTVSQGIKGPKKNVCHKFGQVSRKDEDQAPPPSVFKSFTTSAETGAASSVNAVSNSSISAFKFGMPRTLNIGGTGNISSGTSAESGFKFDSQVEPSFKFSSPVNKLGVPQGFVFRPPSCDTVSRTSNSPKETNSVLSICSTNKSEVKPVELLPISLFGTKTTVPVLMKEKNVGFSFAHPNQVKKCDSNIQSELIPKIVSSADASVKEANSVPALKFGSEEGVQLANVGEKEASAMTTSSSVHFSFKGSTQKPVSFSFSTAMNSTNTSTAPFTFGKSVMSFPPANQAQLRTQPQQSLPSFSFGAAAISSSSTSGITNVQATKPTFNVPVGTGVSSTSASGAGFGQQTSVSVAVPPTGPGSFGNSTAVTTTTSSSGEKFLTDSVKIDDTPPHSGVEAHQPRASSSQKSLFGGHQSQSLFNNNNISFGSPTVSSTSTVFPSADSVKSKPFLFGSQTATSVATANNSKPFQPETTADNIFSLKRSSKQREIRRPVKREFPKKK